MPQVLSILTTFVGTGLVANWLVQKWQLRNWINQQQFLGAEKKYELLRAHADDIAKLSAQRLSAMFRLARSFDQGKEAIEERRRIYSDAIDAWNNNINMLYVRTTMYTSTHLTYRLENDINAKFVSAGSMLEKALRAHAKDEKVDELRLAIIDRLYSLQGIIGIFNRDMLRIVINQRLAAYQGTEIRYTSSDLPYFSNLQLFKALFISRVDDHRVILTSHKLEKPAVRDV